MLWNFKIIFSYKTALLYAIDSSNIDLVKYLVSLDKFDLNEKTILIDFFITFTSI